MTDVPGLLEARREERAAASEPHLEELGSWQMQEGKNIPERRKGTAKASVCSVGTRKKLRGSERRQWRRDGAERSPPWRQGGESGLCP